ncbi:ATP-binding protein [Streptomyces sp. NPDC088337]|uniref:ATP-binding protein n=1 Tax=unclassified Streptomyces TaxID=2593676 RepID=UPI002DD84EEE|nr:ATP-binding protein [Streptomyces sp. NBC_01788]WSB30575.1 ATP-binding protein [Streptomyces sp. NBC_01788]
MNRDALVWCLVAAVVLAVAAVLVLYRRNNAITTKKSQAEAAYTQKLSEAEGQLATVWQELQRHKAEHDQTIREAEEGAEESTKAVLKGSARFLQSLAAEQLTLLEDITRKYGGHAVLGDLLEVNHANAQMARKAQGIAVMCGAPLGRRSKPASVYDVVRSAQGQIRNFRRVEIMQQSGFALKASAVSPVALAVAELLDNAASFSQQGSPIEVTFQRVQKNLCIVIDDAGVGMNDEDRQKASTLLSGEFRPRLSHLGNQPKFGFPVIGLLAQQYGFRVDVTGISRYGGVRAVVLLPEELWTEEEIAPAEVSQVSPIRSATGRSEAGTRTAHGLPKRGARQVPIASVPDAAPDRVPADDDSARPVAPADEAGRSGRSLGAFQRGTLSGRNLSAAPIEGSDNA